MKRDDVDAAVIVLNAACILFGTALVYIGAGWVAALGVFAVAVGTEARIVIERAAQRDMERRS